VASLGFPNMLVAGSGVKGLPWSSVTGASGLGILISVALKVGDDALADCVQSTDLDTCSEVNMLTYTPKLDVTGLYSHSL
jgi:hypothetical protein